jgi:calcineurin-like phosphoesterase family protein
MTTFFTADTHFGHANIIRYCARPFMTAEDMDVALVNNWNARVKPTDVVWHLGDFAFPRKLAQGRLADIFASLNGEKHLVRGNHDPAETFELAWASIGDLRKVEGIVLCHYGLEVWDGSFHGGTPHFHGHSHGLLPKRPNRFDVGVDCRDYRPVTAEEILGWEESI